MSDIRSHGARGLDDPVAAEWVHAGVLVLPTREQEELHPSPVSLDDGVALRLLDANAETRS